MTPSVNEVTERLLTSSRQRLAQFLIMDGWSWLLIMQPLPRHPLAMQPSLAALSTPGAPLHRNAVTCAPHQVICKLRPECQRSHFRKKLRRNEAQINDGDDGAREQSPPG